MNVKKHIGKKLRQERMRVGFSQDGAAKAIGVNRATVCNIENGRQMLTIQNLLSFAVLYDVQPKRFLPKLKDL